MNMQHRTEFFVCGQCGAEFGFRIDREDHQAETGHKSAKTIMAEADAHRIEREAAGISHEIAIDIEPEFAGGAHSERKLPMTHAKAATDAEVVALMLANDGKWEVEQMTPALVAFATDWAKAFEGDFEFMTDMKAEAVKRTLSAGQAKGVLNCHRADYFRNRKATQQAQTVAKDEVSAEGARVPDGKYTVVFEDGSRRTLKIKTQKADATFAAGETIVSYLNGPDNWENYERFGFLTDGNLRVWKRFASDSTLVEAVRVLVGDPRAAASAYGIESGHCGICGRELTVPSSIEAGIGPVCQAKVGW